MEKQKNNHYYTNHPVLRNIGVLLIILLTPPAAIVFWYTSQHLDGSFYRLFLYFRDQGLINGIYRI